jgi:hypothetical protein
LPPADDNLRRRAVDAFAFVAAIDDPSRFRRSLDVYAYVSGEVDYIGGISKCGDKWVRTLDDAWLDRSGRQMLEELIANLSVELC